MCRFDPSPDRPHSACVAKTNKQKTKQNPHVTARRRNLKIIRNDGILIGILPNLWLSVRGLKVSNLLIHKSIIPVQLHMPSLILTIFQFSMYRSCTSFIELIFQHLMFLMPLFLASRITLDFFLSLYLVILLKWLIYSNTLAIDFSQHKYVMMQSVKNGSLWCLFFNPYAFVFIFFLLYYPG